MSGSSGIRIILWMFLVITKGVVVRGQATGVPNAVALINGQAMLDCSVSILLTSSWMHTTDGTNNPFVIAAGCSVTGNNAAYYRTEVQGGNICRLIIANVTMQQAGVYSCFDGLSTTYRSLITVIDPVANVVVHNQSAEVVQGDQLNISCSINYNGPASPAPSLRPSPYWTTSPGQIYNSATYYTSTNVVTLVATVTVQKPTVPIFQCNTVFSITGSTSGYNATAPVDSFTVGNTPELDVQFVSVTTSTTTAPITTAKRNSSKVVESNTNDVAIAMGVLFGISIAVNIAILIIWLCTKLLAKHDPLKSKENVLPPEMMDLSNGTSATSNYEELSRPGEIRLQQSTYEKLTPNTTS